MRIYDTALDVHYFSLCKGGVQLMVFEERPLVVNIGNDREEWYCMQRSGFGGTAALSAAV